MIERGKIPEIIKQEERMKKLTEIIREFLFKTQ